MPVKHSTTQSPGDLIESADWNADHTGFLVYTTLLSSPDGKTLTDPGTSWTTVADGVQITIDLDVLDASYARFYTRIIGNEAGTKYVRITDAGQIWTIELNWSGSGIQNLNSAWTAISKSGLQSFWVQIKASSGTEDITLYKVDLSFK